MKTSTKNGHDSSPGTITKSKQMMQEIWNMSIVDQKQVSKHKFTKTFKYVCHHIKFQWNVLKIFRDAFCTDFLHLGAHNCLIYPVLSKIWIFLKQLNSLDFRKS